MLTKLLTKYDNGVIVKVLSHMNLRMGFIPWERQFVASTTS